MKIIPVTIMISTFLFTFALGFSQEVKTVTFGNGLWATHGIQDMQSNSQTAVVFQDGLTFHLHISSSKGNIGARGHVIGPGRLWNQDGAKYTFSLEVTHQDTASTLDSLSFVSAQLPRLNQAKRSVSLSESASSNTRIIKGKRSIEAADLYRSKKNPLTPLSKKTIDSWDLTFENTGESLTGIGSMTFAYTVGGAPWISLTSHPSVYSDSAAVVTVTPSTAISELPIDDFQITNGKATRLSQTGDSYTLEITPTAPAGQALSIQLPAGSTTPANQASNSLEIAIIDNTPVATLAHPFRPGDAEDPPHEPRSITTVNDNDHATVLINFNRSVSDLTSNDFVITNGTASTLEGKHDRYVLTVTPTGTTGDVVTVNLPADRVIPMNGNQNNQASNAASNSVEFTITDPTLFLDKTFRYDGVQSTTDEVEVIKDVEYGRGHTQGTSIQTKLLLDIYRPIDDAENPILPPKLPLYIAVFGGGFRKGSKTVGHTRGYCEGLVQRGYVAASINYRLSNDETNPPDESALGPTEFGGANIAVRDLAKAIRWLRQNADVYNIDPDRIIIGGNSAGGYTVIEYGNADPGSPKTATYVEEDGESRLVQGSFKFREWEVDDFRTPIRLDVTALHPQHGGAITGTDNITQPIILVHGSKDNIVKVENSRDISKSFEKRKPAPHIHTYLEAPGEAHASFNYWDYISHQKNGKNFEEHWVEFFFEHLALAELLSESPQALEPTFEHVGTHLKTTIKHDERITYQLVQSSDQQTWTPVAGTPVTTNGMLEMQVPATDPKMNYRWDLSFDHQEITLKDYKH